MKVIRFFLFPFSVIYNIVTSIRNLFFDIGIFKSTSFSVPVIVVGNLNVGGTGKSPQIEYLIRLLYNTYKIAVLSRGYKRKRKGFILLKSFHTAQDVGDEPLQFYKKFINIDVAVDSNRVNGISQLLEKQKNIEVVLLDDAFQHRKVKAAYYILLTKYNDLYSDDFLLPTGNLRESRRGAKRANSIVVTKCPKNLSKEEQKEIEKRLNILPNQKVFFSTIDYNENLKSKKELLTIDGLKNKEVVLVTGIANPKPLLEYLENKKVKFIHLKYPDHHHFSNEDISKIKTNFDDFSSNNKIILTTEKDYVRLENKLDDLFYLEIKNRFLIGSNNFDAEIQNFIKK